MVNFNPTYKGYIIRWQDDLVNTKESLLPVCDKPYNTNKYCRNGWGLKICGTMHWYGSEIMVLPMKVGPRVCVTKTLSE